MRKLISPLIFVVGLSLIIVAVALASGGPAGGGFYTGQTLQNVGAAEANVVVTAYDSVSALTYTKNFTVPVGSSITFFSGDLGVPNGFQGSAIVSSDQSLKAIVNVTNKLSGSYGIGGGTAAAQYRGVDSSATGTTVSFPLAKGNFGGKTSAFYIQNAGASSAVFTATFLMGTSPSDPSPVTYQYVSPAVGPGKMAVVISADALAPTGRIGSLKVVSTEPLAGTVLEYVTVQAPALILQGTTGFTPNDYDTRILFPVVKKQLSGRSTGLQVQNVTAGSVGVTMVYHGAGGSCATGTVFTETLRTLAASASTTYLDSALLPAGCLASAEATGTGNIAGVVNEAFLPCTGTCVQRATTYAAFPATNATAKVVAPVFKEDFGSKRTGLSIQNVGNATAAVTVVFKVGVTSYTYGPVNIPVGGSALFLDMTNAAAYPAGNWIASSVMPNSSLAAVTITANQPIIGLANEAPTGAAVQDNINYEAFNVAP